MTSAGQRAVTAAVCSGVCSGVCSVAALVLASASPAAAARLLTQPASDDPTSALVGAVGLTAWAISLWLLLTAAMTAGGHLPGRAGRATARISRRIAPLAVRRAVEVALGLTVTTALLGATPASASSAPLPAEVAAPALDWGSAPASAAPVDAPAAEVSPTPVVVAPGDSLWALAERDLAERSGTAPSDAAVAQAWPAWWAANREAVGPDPHLLHPGTSLTPPAQP